jgi:hypothetical protein
LTGTLNAARFGAVSIDDSKTSSLSATKLTTGTISASRIGNNAIDNTKISDLDAAKLIGTINNDRLNSVPAAKIANGLIDAQIVDLDASKFTGILPLARLPTIPSISLDLGEGLQSTGTSVSVNYDDTAVIVNGSNQLGVKEGGINTAQMAENSVIGSKLPSDITINTTSTITATTSTASSDKRLKENIGCMDDSLNKVCAMEGVSYSFKPSPNEVRSGLIAQDLEHICSELVNHDEKDMLSVNYIDIIPYLIESIKELKEMIDMK